MFKIFTVLHSSHLAAIFFEPSCWDLFRKKKIFLLIVIVICYIATLDGRETKRKYKTVEFCENGHKFYNERKEIGAPQHSAFCGHRNENYTEN